MDEKPDLLLLPGMLCDAASWEAQVAGLSDIARVRVAAYGAADSFEAMAEAVLATAPEHFALAGHSMGGRVAQEIYRRAPDRVTRLALIATDYRGHLSDAARAAEGARREAMLAKAAADGMEGFARDWVTQILPPCRLRDESLTGPVIAMMARQSPQVLAAQSLAGLMRRDNTALLGRISAPTLICAGEEDALRPVEVHRQMAQRIKGSRLVVIERAGHMVAMERPGAVTAALRAWLAG